MDLNIQQNDISFDGWIDLHTAEVSIRQTKESSTHYAPIYDAHQAAYPKSEPDRRYIFCEWHTDTDEVVYWLDLDNDLLMVTNEIGCPRLDGIIRDACRNGTMEEIDNRLGDARRDIRILAAEHGGSTGDGNCSTPDGAITYEQLAMLAEKNGKTVQTFADRLGIMYDGTMEQRVRLLEDWDDDVTVAKLEDDMEAENRNRSTDFDIVYLE